MEFMYVRGGVGEVVLNLFSGPVSCVRNISDWISDACSVLGSVSIVISGTKNMLKISNQGIRLFRGSRMSAIRILQVSNSVFFYAF
jgi:hypothetical protein